MEILHVAAECFPMAKAGGLGDVVGALPKYQTQQGHIAKVVVPMYRTEFLYQQQWKLVHEGSQYLGPQFFHYSVIKEKTNCLGFDLYLIDINGLLDREKIYGYPDDTARFIAFQNAVCDWVSTWHHLPSVIHCHDHHTGLIPFLMQYGFDYKQRLGAIPSVFTVHNAQYSGAFNWDQKYLLPACDMLHWSLLDWHHQINPLATAVKTAWRVTAVSPGYLQELRHSAAGLEQLFAHEKEKSIGILNGIDTDIWDPAHDPYLLLHYTSSTVTQGKRQNKEELCRRFGLDPNLPLFCFIGRMVMEKAADLLPAAIAACVKRNPGKISFLVLGSGESEIEQQLNLLAEPLQGKAGIYIGYQEALSHLMYAGADFMLMPSRVEPCGLNQLYSLRFGTIPVVRAVGGLKDTVIDMGDRGGFGIRFEQASVNDILQAVDRAVALYYEQPDQLREIQRQIMQIDHSWHHAAKKYLQLYQSIQ
ncbi:MAG: glycogen synthase [Sphingomonadales bacterium]